MKTHLWSLLQIQRLSCLTICPKFRIETSQLISVNLWQIRFVSLPLQFQYCKEYPFCRQSNHWSKLNWIIIICFSTRPNSRNSRRLKIFIYFFSISKFQTRKWTETILSSFFFLSSFDLLFLSSFNDERTLRIERARRHNTQNYNIFV